MDIIGMLHESQIKQNSGNITYLIFGGSSIYITGVPIWLKVLM